MFRSEPIISIYVDAHPNDIHFPNVQAECETDPSKEYENPDFCLPRNEGLSGAPNKDSVSQSYETIDIMKVDYVSVYNSPSNMIQNKIRK